MKRYLLVLPFCVGTGLLAHVRFASAKDGELARRAWLDVLGRLPAAGEIEQAAAKSLLNELGGPPRQAPAKMNRVGLHRLWLDIRGTRPTQEEVERAAVKGLMLDRDAAQKQKEHERAYDQEVFHLLEGAVRRCKNSIALATKDVQDAKDSQSLGAALDRLERAIQETKFIMLFMREPAKKKPAEKTGEGQGVVKVYRVADLLSSDLVPGIQVITKERMQALLDGLRKAKTE